jgi:hypothetical protein
MFDGSHLSSNLSLDTGSFQGEFHITSVNPSVLTMFGLGPGFKPDGSVSITFGQSDVTGDDLSAVIGGGTVTIETPTATVVPEPAAMLLFGSALLITLIYQRRRQNA